MATHAQEISRSHYVNARELIKSDSLQLAMVELDSATRISPNFSEAYALKGLIWEQKKDYRRALSQYSLAILHNPNNATNYLKRAHLHFILKDHRNYILNDMNKAIGILPNRADLYALKAYYYVETLNPETLKPDYENAIKAISMAIYLDPKKADYLKLRSQYKFENNQRLSALADINTAIKKDSSNGSFYHYRGLIRFMLGDYRSSLPDLSKAIELEPTQYSYYQLRGNILYNLGKYERAYTDYSKTIMLLFQKIAQTKNKLYPDDPLNLSLRQTLLLRGMTLVQENKPYDGCDDFNRSFQMGETKAGNYMRKYCQ